MSDVTFLQLEGLKPGPEGFVVTIQGDKGRMHRIVCDAAVVSSVKVHSESPAGAEVSSEVHGMGEAFHVANAQLSVIRVMFYQQLLLGGLKEFRRQLKAKGALEDLKYLDEMAEMAFSDE